MYEGRGWDTVGAHAYGHNSVSIGIAFIGEFSYRKPSSSALIAAKQLISFGVSKVSHLFLLALPLRCCVTHCTLFVCSSSCLVSKMTYNALYSLTHSLLTFRLNSKNLLECSNLVDVFHATLVIGRTVKL